MKPMADRRHGERFDVVGALWGQLELTESAQIRNVSTTGALIDSPLPAALDSSQPLRLVVDGHEVKVDAHVRHVRRIPIERGTARYLIGLEFSSPPVSVVQSIEQLGTNLSSE
jgi:PilZ domain